MTNGNETSRGCGYDRLGKRDSFDSMSNRGERSVLRRGFFECVSVERVFLSRMSRVCRAGHIWNPNTFELKKQKLFYTSVLLIREDLLEAVSFPLVIPLLWRFSSFSPLASC